VISSIGGSGDGSPSGAMVTSDGKSPCEVSSSRPSMSDRSIGSSKPIEVGSVLVGGSVRNSSLRESSFTPLGRF